MLRRERECKLGAHLQLVSNLTDDDMGGVPGNKIASKYTWQVICKNGINSPLVNKSNPSGNESPREPLLSC